MLTPIFIIATLVLFDFQLQSFFAGAVTMFMLVGTILLWIYFRNIRIRREKEKEEEEHRRFRDTRIIQFDMTGMKGRLIRRAEAVLRRRTSRFILVLERCADTKTHLTLLQTAESFGVQHVYIIDAGAGSSQNGSGTGGGTSSNGNSILNHVRSNSSSSSNSIISNSISNLTSSSLSNSLLLNSNLSLNNIGVSTNHRLNHRKKDLELEEEDRNTRWLDVTTFSTVESCVAQLQKLEYQIWVVEVGQLADSLHRCDVRVPPKVAIVMGGVPQGPSVTMSSLADRRIYLPLHGFTPSLTLEITCACVLQYLFFLCPEARGNLSSEERHGLRQRWFAKLARSESERKEFLSYIDKPLYPFDDLRLPDEYWKKVSKKRKEELEMKEVNHERIKKQRTYKNISDYLVSSKITKNNKIKE